MRCLLIGIPKWGHTERALGLASETNRIYEKENSGIEIPVKCRNTEAPMSTNQLTTSTEANTPLGISQ